MTSNAPTAPEARTEALDASLKADGLPSLLNIKQAAEALGTSEQSIRRAINTNKLNVLDAQCAPSTGKKRGRRIIRIARLDLARFLVTGGN